MNTLKAILKPQYEYSFSDICFKIKSVTVNINSNNSDIHIQLIGRTKIEKMKSLFLDIYNLIYLYLGHFPTISNLNYNGQDIKQDFNANKFTTNKLFIKSENRICDISDNTINPSTLSLIREYNALPLNSLQNITCEAYSHIALEHELTLLLHVIDSIILDNSVRRTFLPKWQKMLDKKNGTSKETAGKYGAKVLLLCEKTFFPFNSKSEHSLLKALRITKLDFIRTISDTRNSYSHLLPKGKKKKAIFDNPELFFIYLDLIVYLIRLYMLSELKVTHDKSKMNKYYEATHEWIERIK